MSNPDDEPELCVKAEEETRKELMGSLHKLFENGLYSDLTIKCGPDEYKVHKAIVSTRSKFFKACDNDFFVEGRTGVVELREVDPVAVKLMVHFFYHLDYPHQDPPVKVEDISPGPPSTDAVIRELEDEWNGVVIGLKKKKKRMETYVATGRAPNLSIHAKVYELGERYGIRGLKALALGKFKGELRYHSTSGDFLEAIEVVYSPDWGNDNDDAMRKAIVQTINANRSLLNRPAMQDLVRKFNELSFDLVMHFHRNDSQTGKALWGRP
ncbi:hypothetical protein B0T19DRAFT_484060 [Cercophora scortea]|uniref:BTB domain-containing protein n=1 Tax=Cercophora scortea TaxID=314031 RepID=A0AAE0IZM0_9PEZI|nr:hypothetical protein B0T19DRAFT_484060 [Cercophora scortea]